MYQNISRRDLIQQSAAAGVGLLVGSMRVSSADEQEAKLKPGEAAHPIVDTHQHLWDFRKFHPPWLKDEPKLNHSTTMLDYYKATAGLNVVKTVYMEVDVAPKQQLEEAEWVIDVCGKHNTPMAAGVVSLDLPRFHRQQVKWSSRSLAAVDDVIPPLCQRVPGLIDTLELVHRFMKLLNLCQQILRLGALLPLLGSIVMVALHLCYRL